LDDFVPTGHVCRAIDGFAARNGRSTFSCQDCPLKAAFSARILSAAEVVCEASCYREGILLRSYSFVAFAIAFLCVAGRLAGAQEVASAVSAAPVLTASAAASGQITNIPSYQPLADRKWEFGPFENLGAGVGDRFGYYFFATGFQAGKNITPIIHAGPLTGRFEFGANIMPLFQALTPSPYTQISSTGVTQHVGGGRFTPWFQAQGAVLYTTHKFPPTIEVPQGTPGGTSVWNFRSGAGIGFHYFTRPRRSLDFGLNAEHISSASLGDKNPGVNASLQFQIGYSWWK
jgi:lipid A 3-O-deacylase